MTIRTIKLLSGYVFIMVFSRNLLQIVAHPCKEETVNGGLRVNCSNQTLTADDLQSLNANIEVLDLTNATINAMLTADSFSKLKSLKRLSLRKARIGPNIIETHSDPNVFKPLDNLQDLDISGLNQKGFPKYNWPASIKTLRINNTQLNGRLDATDMIMIEFVDISDNEFMTKFPLFNKKAPVKIVIMRGARLEEFTIKDLAPNCRITSMEYSLDNSSPVVQPAHYCECMQVQEWMRKFGIRANNIRCEKNEHPEQCETEFDKSALAQRDECLGSAVTPVSPVRDTGSAGPLLYIAIVFLIALALITLVFVYRYASLRYNIKPIPAVKSPTSEEEEEGDGEGGVEVEDERL